MKVERNPEMIKQLQEAQDLQIKLINYLTLALDVGSEKKKGKKSEVPKNPLLQTIQLSAEGFSLELTSTIKKAAKLIAKINQTGLTDISIIIESLLNDNTDDFAILELSKTISTFNGLQIINAG